ncbi:hemicentin-1-like isoform X2 [Mya arenaria]|uniref:hemicentin-1-like isoform X2 n=1 Tax=Mya arenaria TaxID=6604 RepID=UPI0022E4E434|nr:hemicentin-1-like isoform X2 [Mya arenaria]
MGLFTLFGIFLCGQVISSTLSGNGTSGGFTVQENSSLQLTCSSSTDFKHASYQRRYLDKSPDTITAVGYGSSGCGTDPTPPPYLTCFCVSRREYACVIRNVKRAMNGDVWFCTLTFENDVVTNSGNITIVVQIGITAVSMVLPADHSVSVINNTTRQFRCETSAGNPQATVQWYKDNGTPDRADDTLITTGTETDTRASGSLIVTIGKLTLTVKRNDNEVGIYCSANNGGDWQYSSSVVLDVQYEPSIPKLYYQGDMVNSPVRILSERSITINCSSTGNPSPKYAWKYPGGGSQTGPTFTLASVLRTHAGDITCTATNNLSPTGGGMVDRARQTTASLQILYCNISCSSDAFPTQITYSWSTPGRELVTGKSLFLINVTRTSDKGQYILTAKNTMSPTGGHTETGTNTTAFSVDVQFRPEVDLPETYDIFMGSVLNYSCPFIPGDPSQTSLYWTRSVENRQWHGQFVSISSVQKSDAGLYTCTATNRMTPTGFPNRNGSHSGTMHLNVQYKSLVSDFHVTEYIATVNVTKSEFSNATFNCTVDSNPPSTINIRKDGKIRRSVDNSKQLAYTIANLTCWDAGRYTCDGSNRFNNDTPSEKDLKLFVKCTPRRSPDLDITLNFTAELHKNATLQYTVIAYPVPSPSQFVWKRCISNSKNCSNLSNLSGKTKVTTVGLSSSLTILDIDMDDFGVYSISIANGIGEELVEEMYLQPVGPPDLPTAFDTIEKSIGETQATLTWIPGFNNGFRQTFHLSYRTLNEFATVFNVNVSDNELAKNINYTLNQLRPGKKYYVELFASNADGNSMSVNATFTTLVHLVIYPDGPSAAIVGGSIGSSICAVLIIGGVILGVIKFRNVGNKTEEKLLPGKQHADGLQHPVDEDDELPEIVENSMYVPTGDISRKVNNSDTDALYAQPNKSKASGSEDAELYAGVNKVAKKKAAGKKHKKSTYENKAFENSTYENHELQETKKQVNKDGLIYADLSFPKLPKGQKPLIHGLDDITVYADVDLSRKADPLPDSDDHGSGGKKKK